MDRGFQGIIYLIIFMIISSLYSLCSQGGRSGFVRSFVRGHGPGGHDRLVLSD